MDEKQFSLVASKLDAIMKLLALNISEGKSLKNQVSILSSCGFQPKEIANLLGKSPNHISVILHDLRKMPAKTSEGQDNDGVPPQESKP